MNLKSIRSGVMEDVKCERRMKKRCGELHVIVECSPDDGIMVVTHARVLLSFRCRTAVRNLPGFFVF